MKQEEILHHSSSILPECGYMVRIIELETESAPRIRYSHRDDYYMMGIIVSGNLDCYIDFQRYLIRPDSIIILTPGQVHKFVLENKAVAYMLAVEPGLLDERLRQQLDQQQSLHSPVYRAEDYTDVVVLYKMISRIKNKSVGANLVRAVAEIIADKISAQHTNQIKRTDRKHELMFMFRKLLNENVTKERRPGFYAARLNISTVYLNEITNTVAGLSASEYIRNEIVLLAKRELYYTADSIKEISHRLGVADEAYFSRLFTETVGISPSIFRRNLDKSN